MAGDTPRDDHPAFQIKRLTNPARPTLRPPPPPPPEPTGGDPPKPPKVKKKKAPDPPAPPEPVPAQCGARFHTAAALLSYAGAVAGMRVANDIDLRRSPDGVWWWATVPATWEAVAQLAHTAGGETFLRAGDRWAFAPLGIVPPGPDPNSARRPNADAWPEVGLAELLAGTGLRTARPVGLPDVTAVMPGVLARWVIGRAVEIGLDTQVTSVVCRPLAGNTAPRPAVLLRLTAAADRSVPPALAQAIANLPDAVAGRPVGVTTDRLVVDVRSAVPLGAALLSHLIPENEVWVLGPPAVGHLRLTATGEAVNGATFFEPPAEAAAALVLTDPGPPLPPAEQVRVVPAPTPGVRVDAVLVDDEQLTWLRDYLSSRPAGETAFLLPGPGRHLLTAPGGLAAEVPFGVPLAWVGPGGLYLEHGRGFDPPLPPAARRQAFGASDDHPVAVTADGAYRFDRSKTLPAWVLWTGPVVVSEAGLSPVVEGLLTDIAEAIREAESRPPEPRPAAPGRVRPPEELIAEAMRAELCGDLLTAAGLLEQAGRVLDAARLYERAARQARG